MGFKSGLWLGYPRTFILFFWNHSEVDLLVCFESLSCCSICPPFSFNCLTDCLTFFLQNILINFQINFSINDGKLTRPWGSKIEPQTMTLSPPCFTGGMRFWCWWAVPFSSINDVVCSSQRLRFWFHQSTTYFASSSVECPRAFLWILNVQQCFFTQQWFSPWSPPMSSILGQSFTHSRCVHRYFGLCQWFL